MIPENRAISHALSSSFEVPLVSSRESENACCPGWVTGFRAIRSGRAALLGLVAVATAVILSGCTPPGSDAWVASPVPEGAPAPGALGEERIRLAESRMAAMESRMAAMESRMSLMVELLQRRPSAATSNAATSAPAMDDLAADSSDLARDALAGLASATPTPSETMTSASAASPNRPTTTAAGKVPAPSDRMTIYYPDDPNTINPLIANDNVSAAWLRYMYDSLARQNYANPSQWEPALAESWDFDEETLTYTIRLRRDVMWHDLTTPSGRKIPPQPFTAEDVKFTFDCILNPYTDVASARSYFIDEDIADESERERIEVTVVDDHTIKVRWKRPYFLHKEYTLGGADFFIIPRHIYGFDENGRPIASNYRSKEFGDAFNRHWANELACGTGPMKLVRWASKDRMELVRNESYYGEPFYFSSVVYLHRSNPETAYREGMQGKLDFVSIAEKDKYLAAVDSPEAKDGRINPIQFRSMSYRYMGYNLDRPVFADPKVRLAISHATPVDQIIRDVFKGLAVRVSGPMMPWTPFASPNVKDIPYDLEKARQLLDEAGWNKTNRDGIRIKTLGGVETPLKFDLLTFSESPAFTSTSILIQESLRKIGVLVELKPTQWALMLERLNNKNFDAVLLGWISDYKTDPSQLWHSSQADAPQGNNYGYRSAEVDKAIEELRVTLKEDEQTKLYHKIHELISADQPYTFLFAEDSTAILNGRIQNFQSYPEIRPFYNPREWWSTTPRMAE